MPSSTVSSLVVPPVAEALPPFSFSLRIYWEDTDAGGVVFFANYLKLFERARTEWLRSLGVGQERLRRDHGVMFVVTETTMRYLRPARLDDLLDIDVQLQAAGRVRLDFTQRAWRTGAEERELLAEGRIRIACVGATTWAPARIPPFLLRLIGSTEA